MDGMSRVLPRLRFSASGLLGKAVIYEADYDVLPDGSCPKMSVCARDEIDITRPKEINSFDGGCLRKNDICWLTTARAPGHRPGLKATSSRHENGIGVVNETNIYTVEAPSDRFLLLSRLNLLGVALFQ